MNYYERTQKSIDFIETNLENKIDLNAAAQEAYMSLSNFYRLFFTLVGHSVKEYVRRRRISYAAFEILNHDATVLDLALRFDFGSPDAFSRAFRRITGFLPSEFKKRNQMYHFERVNLMDKYFNIQDTDLIEKYPDIKVLKEIGPMRVAYYCHYGENPENGAFSVMQEWLKRNALNVNERKWRIFGYNNPSPASPEQKEYGYEVCVTIGDNMEVNDDKVKTEVLNGGLYAVTGVRRGENGDIGNKIFKAWGRFRNWLRDSKYIYGGHQWMEEHLGFDEEAHHVGGVDLYMPIVEKPSNYCNVKSFETVGPMWVAAYTATGKDAVERGREFFFRWAESQKFFTEDKNHRFFAYYNYEQIGRDNFFYKIHVTVGPDFVTDNPEIRLEEFPGGYYAVMDIQYKSCGWAWEEFMNWVSKSKDYTFADYWFFEEYKLIHPSIDMETDTVLYMPVRRTE